MFADTTFLIDLAQEIRTGGRGRAGEFLRQRRAARLWTTVISAGELAAGLRHNDAARVFLSTWRIARLYPEIAFAAAAVDRELIATGSRLGENDTWIAGFVRYYGQPLVSNDADFDMVGLAQVISGANVRWIGCQPDTRQRIYFANHTSNLDALVVWASLPARVRSLTRPVAARDYWNRGMLRPYLANQIFHAVLIERKKPTPHDNPLIDMLAALGDKHSLIIFPEGGRQTTGEMAPFKGGLFHLAKSRPDVEFIPVFISNLNRILPKGEFLPVPLLGSVSFGAPIQLENREEKAAFLERARAAVQALETA